MTGKDLHFAIVVACVNNVGIMGPHLVPVATPHLPVGGPALEIRNSMTWGSMQSVTMLCMK